WVEFDASVIRGLSYYTGVVFEAFDRRGELRAIAGGGRYDALLESFGGERTPAVGFGFGDAVIVELMKERGVLPDFEKPSVDVLVYGMDEELMGAVVQVAGTLRASGKTVDVVHEPKKPKWAFRHADRIGAGSVVVVGGDEWKEGQVSVKNLETGEQTRVAVGELGDWAAAAA
ncbi:hypothetical protein TeGR_g3699, partial [Tetraparma gracilis]